MIVSRKELSAKLKTCSPGIETGAVFVDGADCFLFRNGMLYAFNDSFFISTPFLSNLDCAVSAKELASFVHICTDDELSLELKDDTLYCKCGKYKAQFKVQIENIYTRIANLQEQVAKRSVWLDLPSNFTDLLKKCHIKCKNPQIATKVNGVFMEGNVMMSTNNIAINYFTLDEELPKLWLSSKALDALTKLPKPQRVSCNEEAWVYFDCGESAQMACRKYNADLYPNEQTIAFINGFSFRDNGLKVDETFKDTVKAAISFSGENPLTLKRNMNILALQASKAGGQFDAEVCGDGEAIAYEVLVGSEELKTVQYDNCVLKIGECGSCWALFMQSGNMRTIIQCSPVVKEKK